LRDEFRNKQTSRHCRVAGVPNARSRKDRGGLYAEWLAPANNATAVALHGPWHMIGREQIARMFATEVRKLFVADVAAEFRGCYADGNVVVIEQRLRATLANGNAYDNDYCFVLELEDGLIHRVREYMDTAKGNRMVFGAG
jgi:ketosteroid isomerase-like protein